MKKWVCVLYTFVFMGLCAAPLLGLIFGYENVNAEKRALASPPDIIKNGQVNFDFTKQFDDYFTDNFAFRTNLVTLNAFLNAGVFGESVSEQVIIGKDGWLFFEPTLRDYKKQNTLSDNEIYRLARTLKIQCDALLLNGTQFIFAVAPNKASVYGRYMPDRYKVTGDMSNAEKLFAAFDECGFVYADLFTPLRESSMRVYHKQDTHWNNTGALIARRKLLETARKHNDFGFRQYDIDAFTETEWEGDLAAMLYPAARVRDTQQDYGVKKEYETLRPMRSLEDLTIMAESATGELNALMFRDSFANALIPILSNDFAAVTYSRAVPYDYSLLKEDTDIVILQIAERNLPDLLLAAPLLSAPRAYIDVFGARALDCRIDIKFTEDSIRIAGIAAPPGHEPYKNYDVYVRISGGDTNMVFTPFPILEKDAFEGEEHFANAAFSMLLDKSILYENEYAVEVMLFDGARWFVSNAQSLRRV
ncbi:MAG: hypothetical protein WDA65_07730 [Christensenellales bacterium]